MSWCVWEISILSTEAVCRKTFVKLSYVVVKEFLRGQGKVIFPGQQTADRSDGHDHARS